MRKGIDYRVLELDQNRTNSVLLKFKEILLALSQHVKTLRSALTLEQRDLIYFAKHNKGKGSKGDPFTGMTLEVFRMDGNVLTSKDLLIRDAIGVEILSLRSLRTLAGML